MSRKAEDAGGLTPAKDDNAARRKIDRKDNSIFRLVDYNINSITICIDLARNKAFFSVYHTNPGVFI